MKMRQAGVVGSCGGTRGGKSGSAVTSKKQRGRRGIKVSPPGVVVVYNSSSGHRRQELTTALRPGITEPDNNNVKVNSYVRLRLLRVAWQASC